MRLYIDNLFFLALTISIVPFNEATTCDLPEADTCKKFSLLKKYITDYPIKDEPKTEREMELNYRIEELKRTYDNLKRIDNVINSFENYIAIEKEVSNILHKTITQMNENGNNKFAVELQPYQNKSILAVLQKIHNDTKLQENVTPLLNNLVKKDVVFREKKVDKALDKIKGAFRKVSDWGKNVLG